MKLSKWFVSASAILISAAVAAVSLTACKKDDQPVSDPQYLQKVSEYTYFKNTTDSEFPNTTPIIMFMVFWMPAKLKTAMRYLPRGRSEKSCLLVSTVCA